MLNFLKFFKLRKEVNRVKAQNYFQVGEDLNE